MSKFFFPEYPNKEYIHSKFKRQVSADILNAFQLFTSKYDIDIKYKASIMKWYITIDNRTVKTYLDTRFDAVLWILENIYLRENHHEQITTVSAENKTTSNI